MFVVLCFIIIITFIFGVYRRNTTAMCKSKKRLDGKSVVVTGGTLGMGLEIAVDLARRGARVIVASPFENEGERAIKHIVQQSGNENVIFKYLDLASLESVHQFASDVLENEDNLDILINNVGVGIPRDTITKDGMHFIMQVNYYGAFLLTLLLLPLLKKTGRPSEPSRIVNTSSITHWIGYTKFDNLNTKLLRERSTLTLVRIYGASKLCLVLFTHELAKKLKLSNVVVNSVDPGFVGTRIYESWYEFWGGILKWALYYLVQTPWQGAQTALYVALNDKAGKVSGQFFKHCRLSKARALAYDDETAGKLWQDSMRLVNMSDDILNMG